ncbi:hypothetical protein Q1695_004757 [Nippostrongylus brasiliensis]|nr:hypothetical protein Q1695_004757 [Nippostrongylus brasiliensis]
MSQVPTSKSSYSNWMQVSMTASTAREKSNRRISSKSMGTEDEVSEEMPEMQLCDGSCGQMVMVNNLKQLNCTHLFCTPCLTEAERIHLHCKAVPVQKINNMVHCQDDNTSDSETSVLSNVHNCRRVVFEYNSQKAVLWLTPSTTYVRLANLIGSIFAIPENHKITFSYSANASTTGEAYSASSTGAEGLATTAIPTSAAVSLRFWISTMNKTQPRRPVNEGCDTSIPVFLFMDMLKTEGLYPGGFEEMS